MKKANTVASTECGINLATVAINGMAMNASWKVSLMSWSMITYTKGSRPNVILLRKITCPVADRMNVTCEIRSTFLIET